MKLICGLGNPGLKYRDTRHNIGYLVIDSFAKINKPIKSSDQVVLLKPRQFMNNSGVVIKQAVKKLNVPLKDILVVCDDVNLELGIIRFRAGGSAGGHNGLKSIIETLGTDGFNRLRIGIGAAAGNKALRDYVLSVFERDEKQLLREAVDKAALAIKVWAGEGIEAAMNKFNTKNSTTKRGEPD
ncbi:MAG: aminoacyl-tRNA hydrolase [Candidatus Omnitrophica bacterium]|nr:aminoacyl-tRNA hydrolase [Candidatus Omnitrophota bacterium]